MHGLVTFFKTIELKLSNGVSQLIVVHQEGNFINGSVNGMFRRYDYDLFYDLQRNMPEDEFSKLIQDYFEIVPSEDSRKTLRSKFFIEQNFNSKGEICGLFRQYKFNFKTKVYEMIQSNKINSNLVGTYSIWKNRRLVERGDVSN